MAAGVVPAVLLKCVWFARRSFEFQGFEESVAEGVVEESSWETFVDRPRPGTRIEPGEPICSVLLGGADEEDVRRRLERLSRVNCLGTDGGVISPKQLIEPAIFRR